MEPRFLDYAGWEEWAELVSNFTAATTAIVATVNLEDILRSIA